MYSQAMALIAITVVIIVAFMAKAGTKIGLSLAPMLTMPLAQLLSVPISNLIINMTDAPRPLVVICVYIVALAKNQKGQNMVYGGDLRLQRSTGNNLHQRYIVAYFSRLKGGVSAFFICIFAPLRRKIAVKEVHFLKKQKKNINRDKTVLSIVNSPPAENDPLGSYTGKPKNKNEKPTQDRDDL